MDSRSGSQTVTHLRAPAVEYVALTLHKHCPQDEQRELEEKAKAGWELVRTILGSRERRFYWRKRP